MEGSKYAKTGWLTALGSTVLLLVGATEGRAELQYVAPLSWEETIPSVNVSALGPERRRTPAFVLSPTERRWNRESQMPGKTGTRLRKGCERNGTR